MTMNKLINRLGKNAVAFTLADEAEKSAACMSIIEMIHNKGYQNIRGKLELNG